MFFMSCFYLTVRFASNSFFTSLITALFRSAQTNKKTIILQTKTSHQRNFIVKTIKLFFSLLISYRVTSFSFALNLSFSCLFLHYVVVVAGVRHSFVYFSRLCIFNHSVNMKWNPTKCWCKGEKWDQCDWYRCAAISLIDWNMDMIWFEGDYFRLFFFLLLIHSVAMTIWPIEWKCWVSISEEILNLFDKKSLA